MVQLYVDTLDQYLFYLDRGATAVRICCACRDPTSELIPFLPGDAKVCQFTGGTDYSIDRYHQHA